ncbi:MAG: activase [Rubrivivax sp.]|nr:activase [Rubrivivax sp.]
MKLSTRLSWYRTRPSVPPAEAARRAQLRIGIPKVLSVWGTHQFWIGLLTALGVAPRNIVFSSDTSEQQARRWGLGRGTVESCHPVKCASGHYGELLFGQRQKIDVLLHPMISSLPSFLGPHVKAALACPRDVAAAECVRAGFQRERDLFAEHGVAYLHPLVPLGEPDLVAQPLYEDLRSVLALQRTELETAVAAGYRALDDFAARLRGAAREVLVECARNMRPCVMVLARPYHMDPGLGHGIETELQAHGYPVLWAQHLPLDPALLDWLFGDEIRRGEIRGPFDIADVWLSSYSANTNEIVWGAKVAARLPWISCVLRLSSYECGLDQPTLTPVQRIVEASGTLYFRFGDLDATKPAGALKLRTETILHYLERQSQGIIRRKLASLAPRHPFEGAAAGHDSGEVASRRRHGNGRPAWLGAQARRE